MDTIKSPQMIRRFRAAFWPQDNVKVIDPTDNRYGMVGIVRAQWILGNDLVYGVTFEDSDKEQPYRESQLK